VAGMVYLAWGLTVWACAGPPEFRVYDVGFRV
jgi:hypothetical protein